MHGGWLKRMVLFMADICRGSFCSWLQARKDSFCSWQTVGADGYFYGRWMNRMEVLLICVHD